MQSNQKIAPVHPTIDSLQTAREAVAVASHAHHLSNERLIDAAMKIDPHRWAKAIEKSLLGEKNSDELRLDYEELAITFVSVLLKQEQASKALQEARTAHNKALQQLVTVHDTIADRTAESWIKQHLRAAYVINSQESVAEKPKSYPQLQPPLEIPALVTARAKRILFRIFEAFAQNIPVKSGYYTTASVVASGPYKSFPVNGFRKRDLLAVPIEPQDGLSINVQLYEQLQRIETLSKTAKEAQRLVSPYESMREDHYEATILDTLCEFKRPEASVFGSSDVVELIRRRQSDSMQSSLFFETRQLTMLEFRKDYEKLIKLLVEATAEATQFIQTARTKAPLYPRRISSTAEATQFIQTARTLGYHESSFNSNWNVWIVMNNCLVADLKLREYGEQLKPFVNHPRAYDSREEVRREFERLADPIRRAKSADRA
jgi:hypothetical protein